MTAKAAFSGVAIAAVAFTAGALLAGSPGRAPVFAAVVQGADGKPSFQLEKVPQRDFVYVGFHASHQKAGPQAHALVQPPLCPDAKNPRCKTSTAAAPVGGTIICYPGECNPPTQANLPKPTEQLILVLEGAGASVRVQARSGE